MKQITLPVTCRTLCHIIGISMLIVGIPTSILFHLNGPNIEYFFSFILMGVGVAYIIMASVYYFIEHDFPFRCKCDKNGN